LKSNVVVIFMHTLLYFDSKPPKVAPFFEKIHFQIVTLTPGFAKASSSAASWPPFVGR
jgi:hypothetical protein